MSSGWNRLTSKIFCRVLATFDYRETITPHNRAHLGARDGGAGVRREDDFLVLAYAPDKNLTDTGLNKKPSIYVLATIHDKSAFEKIAPTLKMSDADAAAADPSADTAKHGPLSFYSVKNDLVVLGGDRRQVNTFFSRPAGGPNPAAKLLTDRAMSNAFTLGVDMPNLTRFLAVVMTKGDSLKAKDQKLLDALGKIDGLLISSGAIHENAMESYFELRMTDQTKNSLSSLLDLIASLSKKPDGTSSSE